MRAGFSDEDLIRSQRSAEIGSAREHAAKWKGAVLDKRIDLDLRELDAATDLDDIAEQLEEAIDVGGDVTRRVCGYALGRAERLACISTSW